jgi:hypothetical protein
MNTERTQTPRPIKDRAFELAEIPPRWNGTRVYHGGAAFREQERASIIRIRTYSREAVHAGEVPPPRARQ